MSRGLGSLQRWVLNALAECEPITFAQLVHAQACWAVGGDHALMTPTMVRKLRRALSTLEARGLVLISGTGGPADPRRYTDMPPALVSRPQWTDMVQRLNKMTRDGRGLFGTGKPAILLPDRSHEVLNDITGYW